MLRFLAFSIVGAALGSALTFAFMTPEMRAPRGLEHETESGSAPPKATPAAALDALGDGAEALDAAAAGVPPGGRAAFTIEALASRARWDPQQAAVLAVALEDASERLGALRTVATVWAGQAPAAAMAYGAALPNTLLRSVFCNEVLAAWGRLDPQAALAAAADVPLEELGGLPGIPGLPGVAGVPGVYDPLSAAVALDPERALATLDRYAPALRRRIELLALRAVAEQDPEAARVRAEAMLPGLERNQLLSYVAESWVSKDPDAALAWLDSLDPPVPSARRAAVEVLARVDFDRALELWLSDENRLAVPAGLPLAQHLDRMPSLMDRLLAMPPPAKSALAGNLARDTVLSTWTRLAPEAALGWLAAQDSVDSRLVEVVAGALAGSDPERAAAAVEHVPGPLRGNWIDSVAGTYADTDPAKALSWLGGFRGAAGYDDWVTTVVERAAGRDPAAAARLLAAGDASVQRNTPYVAQRWAAEDPARAAEWAAALPSAAQRDAAVRMVAAQWANDDPEAVRLWAVGFAGPARDAAVTAIIEADIGRRRTIDRSLLDALSDPAARQRLVRIAVPTLARNPVRARELVDAYIVDPDERRAALEELERLAR